jgi:DNA processing protein
MKKFADIAYWLALIEKSRLLPIATIEQIFKRFNSIEPLWTEGTDFLKSLSLSDNEIRKIIQYRNSVEIEHFNSLSESLANEGIQVIRYVDEEYPKLLKEFGEYHIGPPLALLVRGSLKQAAEVVAIVGTRECSFYGHMMARKIARTVAKAGYIVASGLARGVDTEAHCGALEAPRGKTYAVLPWMEMKEFYPPENIKLASDIMAKGALISEYYLPPRELPASRAPAAFVIRNRIISGLSRCVILIESGLSGGTFRQATIALKQGRKVFALRPKQKNKEALEGFLKFLEMGATPIDDAKQVLDYLRRQPSTAKKEKRIDSFYPR